MLKNIGAFKKLIPNKLVKVSIVWFAKILPYSNGLFNTNSNCCLVSVPSERSSPGAFIFALYVNKINIKPTINTGTIYLRVYKELVRAFEKYPSF